MPYVHGFHPVREALRRRPHQVLRVVIARRESGPRIREIAELGARHGVPVVHVDWGELRRVAPEARQGIAAEVAEVATVERLGDRRGGGGGKGRAAGLDLNERSNPAQSGGSSQRPRSGVGAELDCAPFGSRQAAPPHRTTSLGRDPQTQGGAPVTRDPELVVLLEDVQDPRNLGALLRVCEGAGVGRVLIRDRGSAPVTPTVVQASAGATEWLDVERVTNSAAELERLKKEGFWIYGAAEGGVPPWELDLTGPVALCFGGEANGLRRLTRERCDRLVGLPMRGRVESLNVATAAAALLYEAVRQRTPPRRGK